MSSLRRDHIRASEHLPMSRHRSWLYSFMNSVMPNRFIESHRNEMDMGSTSTVEDFARTNALKEVTARDTKAIVTDIVKEIFDHNAGHASVSSSQCSLQNHLMDSLDMDPRLKLWYDTLQDRALVQAKIQRQLGRRPDEMLINLPTTVGARDKGTVTRILDLADRMNPTALVQRKPVVTPEQPDAQQCLPPLQETLPRAERTGKVRPEISALTRATKQEIMGKPLQPKKNRTQWLQSKVLDERIERKSEDIKRVIDHFPETEDLEVVGSCMQEVLLRHESRGNDDEPDIERLSASSMYSVSSSSQLPVPEERRVQLDLQPTEIFPVKGAAVKINDVLYYNSGRRCPQPEVASLTFECHPYQNMVKDLLRIENVGRLVVTCHWNMQDTGKRVSQAFAPVYALDAFLMGDTAFTIFPGEVHVCRVMYRPRECHMLRLRYELRIFPNVLGTLRSCFVVRLCGKCVPSPVYTGKMKSIKEKVIAKSKKKMTDTLAQEHASLVPLIQPHEVVCPYERVFDEREVFNAQNPGYRCERFDDLETLKALYQKLKKPREPAWDLRLETIRQVILRLPQPSERELHFEELIEVEEAIKGGGIGSAGDGDMLSPARFGRSTERDRSRFIYVRGCIGNGIQEWEEMMAAMEVSALKLEVTQFQAKLLEAEANEGEDGEEPAEPKPWMQRLRQEDPVRYLLKRLRSRKAYRDSLYMQTYSHLCDLAENVVSVIESTQYV
ncbi:uncharacterized protein [Drosophila bipectinata]|uniref:uncharacterized protein n=1 Tax=Drosophila bipectinata TaxID=42026 RepID=UPI001C8A8A59|nr:uncharacterized protein LOC108123103 [Drosophila bipectinata]